MVYIRSVHALGQALDALLACSMVADLAGFCIYWYVQALDLSSTLRPCGTLVPGLQCARLLLRARPPCPYCALGQSLDALLI